jgi:hypothetical protein
MLRAIVTPAAALTGRICLAGMALLAEKRRDYFREDDNMPDRLYIRHRIQK